MTNRSYSEQFKEIKKDIYKTCDGITSKLAKEARNDLQSAARSIIDNFYYSYQTDTHEPKYYVRTHNLYKSINTSPVLSAPNNSYKATIDITAYTMFDNYNISPDVVFDLMWNQGHRGLPFQDLKPTWKPSIESDGVLFSGDTPHDLIKKFVNNWDKTGKKKLKNIEKEFKSNSVIIFR